MKVAVERTGGLVVLAESFGHSVFKDSFRRVFEAGDHALGLSFKYALVTMIIRFWFRLSRQFTVHFVLCRRRG